jgi:hypothetical protein
MDMAELVAQAEDQQTNRWAADSAELMRWKGRHLLPSRGCQFAWHMPFGDSSAVVEYEIHDDRVVCIHALINGRMVKVEDAVHPAVVERWEAELWAAVVEDNEARAAA